MAKMDSSGDKLLVSDLKSRPFPRGQIASDTILVPFFEEKISA